MNCRLFLRKQIKMYKREKMIYSYIYANELGFYDRVKWFWNHNEKHLSPKRYRRKMERTGIHIYQGFPKVKSDADIVSSFQSPAMVVLYLPSDYNSKLPVVIHATDTYHITEKREILEGSNLTYNNLRIFTNLMYIDSDFIDGLYRIVAKYNNVTAFIQTDKVKEPQLYLYHKWSDFILDYNNRVRE